MAEHPMNDAVGSDDDEWEPSDDPDEWDADGVRRQDFTETRLYWRIVTPSGVTIDVDASGFPFTTRRDAVLFTGSPVITPTTKTFDKLLTLTATVAGWAKITADGWTVEPIKPDA